LIAGLFLKPLKPGFSLAGNAKGHQKNDGLLIKKYAVADRL
jgi:hypothetical protein